MYGQPQCLTAVRLTEKPLLRRTAGQQCVSTNRRHGKSILSLRRVSIIQLLLLLLLLLLQQLLLLLLLPPPPLLLLLLVNITIIVILCTLIWRRTLCFRVAAFSPSPRATRRDLSICLSIYPSIYLYILLYIYTSIYLSIFLYLSLSLSLSHVCIHIYIYIYINKQQDLLVGPHQPRGQVDKLGWHVHGCRRGRRTAQTHFFLSGVHKGGFSKGGFVSLVQL